jgi:hypothetical protein
LRISVALVLQMTRRISTSWSRNGTQNPGLDHRQGPDGGDCPGRALEPVTDRDADVLDAAVLDFGQHREPELGAVAAVADPGPQDAAFTVEGDADRDVVTARL